MDLIFHGPVDFVGHFENPGRCLVRVWQHPRGQRPSLCVVSEDPRNLGGSPFGCAEALSTNVCRMLDMAVDTVWWVEHYTALPGHAGHPLGSDRFAVVEFGSDGRTPRRRALRRIPRTLIDVEQLAGGVLVALRAGSAGTPIGGTK